MYNYSALIKAFLSRQIAGMAYRNLNFCVFPFIRIIGAAVGGNAPKTNR